MLNLLLRVVCVCIGGFVGFITVVVAAFGLMLLAATVPGVEGAVPDSALKLAMVALTLGATLTGMILGWILPARLQNPRCCRRCGYNLTGNRTGRCPECGEGLTASQRALVGD